MSNFIDYPINFSCADNEKRDYFKPIILFVNWQWCKFYRFEFFDFQKERYINSLFLSKIL